MLERVLELGSGPGRLLGWSLLDPLEIQFGRPGCGLGSGLSAGAWRMAQGRRYLPVQCPAGAGHQEAKPGEELWAVWRQYYLSLAALGLHGVLKLRIPTSKATDSQSCGSRLAMAQALEACTRWGRPGNPAVGMC